MVKRMMAGVMTLLLLCLCVGCGNNRSADMPETVPNSDESTLDADAEETENIESETEDSMEQKQILVAYFSRTGNTETLASEIGSRIGGNLFEIEPVDPYPEDYDETVERFRRERDENARPAIINEVENMEQYDIVFVGFPNWGDDMPHIVYTFLEQYDFSGKTIIPFCTNGGGGFGNSIAGLEETCPDSVLAEGFECSGSRIQNETDEIEEWLNELGMLTEK